MADPPPITVSLTIKYLLSDFPIVNGKTCDADDYYESHDDDDDYDDNDNDEGWCIVDGFVAVSGKE